GQLSGSYPNPDIATSVAGTGLTGGGGSALSVLYGSSAGNAVQVMNLMMGFDEREGIAAAPLHPV
ncbi:MAG: hypothetical protein JRM90_03690, partial [Nitrososphaerota archaeon]|nr:hypothetical protein [Nitrososphaerota archaeon]